MIILAWAPGTEQESLGTCPDHPTVPSLQQEGDDDMWASSLLDAGHLVHSRIHQALCLDHNRHLDIA